MLKAFQKRNKWKNFVFGSILVLIALSMVLYLIPGVTGFGSDPAFTGVVAEVQGEQIQAFELQQALFQFGLQNRIPAELMELYSTQILDNMLLERATLREAEQLGLQVSETELVQQLRRIPDLFPDGNFVGRQAYEDIVYTRFHVTLPEFERQLRNSILREKLRSMITDPVVVYPEEIRKAFQEDNEKMVLDYALIDMVELREGIEPGNEELQEYYQTNQARYQIPEKRSGQAIVFDELQTGLGITIPESELQVYYRNNQNDFRVEERVQVSHILLRAAESNKEEVRTKAEDLLTQIQDGADFAELARENSEDPGSAANGGDLGWVVRGQTVPPFEQAAFSLEPDSLSDLVETTFGFHILKAAEHEQARLRPFDEVRAEIGIALRRERILTILPRQAEEAAAALRSTPGDGQAIAERLNAQFRNFGPLAAGDPFLGLGPSPELGQELFILQEDEVGRPIPVQTGYVVPVVTAILPAHPGGFEEVKDLVQRDFVDEQARQQASARAAELADALGQQEEKNLQQAARTLGAAVQTSQLITRATPIPSVGLPSQLDPSLFSKDVGEVAGPFPVASGHIIFQIASKEAPNEEDFSTQQALIEQRLLVQKKDQAFALFEDNLRSRLEAEGDLVIHYDVLSRMAAGTPGEHPPYPHSHPPGF